MLSRNRFLNDLFLLAGSGCAVARSVGDEVRMLARQQVDRYAHARGWVSREEFEAVRDMAGNARTVQEDLAERLRALEDELATLKPRAGDTPDGAPDEDGDPPL